MNTGNISPVNYDIDGSGSINILDMYSITLLQIDMNSDGVVNEADVTIVAEELDKVM